MADCAIIIPYYTNLLTAVEKYSLETALKIFNKRDLYFISPSNIEIDSAYSSISIVRFPEKHFSSIKGYNQLLLSTIFYEKFLPYKYILIYQLDALAFKDELDYWCSLDYDYYGAPWNHKTWGKKYFNIFGLLDKRVGNGGFCLRKTAVFCKMANRIKIFKTLIKFGEDIFWCNFGKLFYSKFRVISEDMAVRFAFETKPEELFKRSGNQLPFGCHSFEKNSPLFWKSLFPAIPLKDGDKGN